MKSVIVHGLLALFGLGFAYQTWTRAPEEDAAAGSVSAAECDLSRFEKLSLKTPTLEVFVEPERSAAGAAYWLTLKRVPVEKKLPPDAGVVEIAKAKEVEPPKRFLANATFINEYIKRLTPLRALRSLGTLKQSQEAAFGFDKVGTYLKFQCAGRTSEFEAGSRAFGANQRYLRDQKSKTTYLFDEALVGDLESAQFKFMQSELHTFEKADVEELTVEAQSAKKRLLQRDRKLPEQALLVDASAPAKRNELYGNWFGRLSRLRVRTYLAQGAEPGSDLKGQLGATEPVLTVTYKVADKPDAKLELVRVEESGTGHYYARTETTRGWVSVYDSSAKEVEQDVGMVVGTEQPKPAGEKPADATKSPSAASPHAATPSAATPSASEPPASPLLGPHGHSH